MQKYGWRWDAARKKGRRRGADLDRNQNIVRGKDIEEGTKKKEAKGKGKLQKK